MDSLNKRIEPENLKKALSVPSISVTGACSPELNSQPGFRAAEAYIRPSPVAIYGKLVQYGFDLQNCVFTMSLTATAPTPENSPTVIYLPEFHYPTMHTEVTVTGGRWVIDSVEAGPGVVKHLKWWHAEGEQSIEIRGAKRKAGDIIDNGEDEAYLEQCKREACILM